MRAGPEVPGARPAPAAGRAARHQRAGEGLPRSTRRPASCASATARAAPARLSARRCALDYDYGVGRAGNVGAGLDHQRPGAAAGLTGGATRCPPGAARTPRRVTEGEQQITRYLQHRDRLVTAQDFETITLRTPGVAIGRVEVLPAFHPALSPNEPGRRAGRGDADGHSALRAGPAGRAGPGPLFLDAIACWLSTRGGW